jgi:DNA-binding response OmpR family regulator/cell division protein FtsN
MAGKVILVVDSDAETAQKIETALESEDYMVFIASTVEFGITMARKVRPALIFVNPALSGGSGLDFCRTVHGMEALGNVPVIALSPYEGETDPRYFSGCGIVGTLGKPFTPEDLISKTAEALSLRSHDETIPSEEINLDEGAGADEKTGAPEIPGQVAEDMLGEGEERTDGIVVRLAEKRERVKKKEILQTTAQDEITEEPPMTRESFEMENDMGFTGQRPSRRRREQGPRLTVPVIAAGIIIILGAAGAVVYRTGLMQKKEERKAVAPTQDQTLLKGPAPGKEPLQGAAQDSPRGPAAVPSPSPESALTVRTEPGPAGRTTYSVQIGAFKDERNAEVLAKQYKEKGYEAFVQSIPKDREMLHRVLIGKFENRKEAWKLAGDIGDRENIKAIVTGD